MADYFGVFYGYREIALPRVMGGPGWRFKPKEPEIRLKYWHWDLLGSIPYFYEVYWGYTEEEYPDGYTLFPFESRLIMATIRDAPLYCTFTYDGFEPQPERRFGLGFARVEAAKGFMVRNAEPGIPSQYQFMVFR